ncbi:MAG: hypothetical protein AAFX99_20120, partial [Myxococcota bacterium]
MDKQIQEYLSRLTKDPRDLHALDDLQDTFAKNEQWGDLANLLFEQAEHTSNAELQARLMVQAGEVVGFRLGNTEMAEELFRRALELNGSGGVELDAQIGLLRLQGNWDGVLQLHRRALQIFDAPVFKSRALFRMGEVYRDHIGDRSNAMKAFQNAFKADRECYRALDAARRIYAEVQNWDLVGKLYTIEIKQRVGDGSASEDVAQLMAEMGDVLRLRIGNAPKATPFYKQALNYDPANPIARAGLEALGVELPPLPEPAASAAADEDPAAAEVEVEVDMDVEPEIHDAEETAGSAEDDGGIDIDMDEEPVAVDVAVEEPHDASHTEDGIAGEPEAVDVDVEVDPAEEEAGVEVDVDVHDEVA